MASTRADRRQVVVVTGGGGSGCGRAISLRFAADGRAIVVSDVDEAGGEETVRRIRELGAAATYVGCDVRDATQVQRLFDQAETTFGGVDVLVNNASAPHGDATLDSWMDALQTDLLGAVATTRAAVHAMQRRGGGSSSMWRRFRRSGTGGKRPAASPATTSRRPA